MTDRYFYHSFPRPRAGESCHELIERGWAILKSIKRSGLILAPEIVEWKTPVSIGSRSPVRICQQRICFTELSRKELDEHSKKFGPYAIEFNHMELRRAGALPVIYMPQALSKEDYFALFGSIIVSHVNHIMDTLKKLDELDKFNDPSYIQTKFSGAEEISENCVFSLKNVDEAGNTVQEFCVPWSAIRDFLSYLRFQNAPFDAMIGVASIAQSLFYPTDDDHVDDLLGYYRQREWRITAGYSVNGIPRGRSLNDDERRELMDIDQHFWMHKLGDCGENFCRIDKASVLSYPSREKLFRMISRIFVPKEKIHDARQSFGSISTISC